MKVLIVEDRPDNTLVALNFFEKKGIEADIAHTAEDAKKKLEEEIYFGAIIDVEIPRVAGQAPEKLGHEVGKLAKELETPYVYLTGGYHHGHQAQAKVFVDEFCLERNAGKMVPDKTNPESWAVALTTLFQDFGHLQEVYESRVRYKKITGKLYRRT